MQTHLAAVICKDQPKPQGALQRHVLVFIPFQVVPHLMFIIHACVVSYCVIPLLS